MNMDRGKDLPRIRRVAVSSSFPASLVAVHLYVPASSLAVERMLRTPSPSMAFLGNSPPTRVHLRVIG